jgi:purine-cytosine permease-like protein
MMMTVLGITVRVVIPFILGLCLAKLMSNVKRHYESKRR